MNHYLFIMSLLFQSQQMLATAASAKMHEAGDGEMIKVKLQILK